jgi:hypothetical protein
MVNPTDCKHTKSILTFYHVQTVDEDALLTVLLIIIRSIHFDKVLSDRQGQRSLLMSPFTGPADRSDVTTIHQIQGSHQRTSLPLGGQWFSPLLVDMFRGVEGIVMPVEG